MRFRFLIPAMIVLSCLAQVFVPPAQAEPQAPPRLAELAGALLLPDLFEVLHQEGLAAAQVLQQDMLAGRGGAEWEAQIAAIYDPERFEAEFMAGLERDLTRHPDVVAAALAYALSEPGRQVFGLEVSARAAMLDEGMQEAAREAYGQMRAGGEAEARLDLLAQRIAVNDLIEANVAAALNANLAFLFRFSAAGLPGIPESEAEILRDVMAQEPEIRAETELWLMSYLALAYQPLSDAELAEYIAFCASPVGQVLHNALFAAFDAPFERIAAELGAAAGRVLAGRDL